MSARATGTFEITAWEQEDYDPAEGALLSRARVTKRFSGEIEGTSVADLLLATTQGDSAAYVGLERVVAEVHDRAGTFVLVHRAVGSVASTETVLAIVPGSGTGELAGLRGAATIVRTRQGGHLFTLEYDLD